MGRLAGWSRQMSKDGAPGPEPVAEITAVVSDIGWQGSRRRASARLAARLAEGVRRAAPRHFPPGCWLCTTAVPRHCYLTAPRNSQVFLGAVP